MKAVKWLFLALSLSFISCNDSTDLPKKQNFLLTFFDKCGIKPMEGGHYLVLQNTGCTKCIQQTIDSLHRFEQLPSFHIITDGIIKIPEVNVPVITVKASTIRNANLELYTSSLLIVNCDTISKKYTLDNDLYEIFELLD